METFKFGKEKFLIGEIIFRKTANSFEVRQHDINLNFFVSENVTKEKLMSWLRIPGRGLVKYILNSKEICDKFKITIKETIPFFNDPELNIEYENKLHQFYLLNDNWTLTKEQEEELSKFL